MYLTESAPMLVDGAADAAVLQRGPARPESSSSVVVPVIIRRCYYGRYPDTVAETQGGPRRGKRELGTLRKVARSNVWGEREACKGSAKRTMYFVRT